MKLAMSTQSPFANQIGKMLTQRLPPLPTSSLPPLPMIPPNQVPPLADSRSYSEQRNTGGGAHNSSQPQALYQSQMNGAQRTLIRYPSNSWNIASGGSMQQPPPSYPPSLPPSYPTPQAPYQSGDPPYPARQLYTAARQSIASNQEQDSPGNFAASNPVNYIPLRPPPYTSISL